MTEIPDWLRRKMFGTLTPEEYGKVLEKKIADGQMTPEEAEMEWQDYTHRDEGRPEW